MLCGLIYQVKAQFQCQAIYLSKEKKPKENHLNNGPKTTTYLGSSPIESFYLNASIYGLDNSKQKKNKKLSDMLEMIMSCIYLLENYL